MAARPTLAPRLELVRAKYSNGRRGRSAHALVTLAAAAVALAVGLALWQAGGRRQQPARRFARLWQEWEVPEWQLNRYLAHGQPLEAIGFGSGGNITTVVQRNPRAIYQFEYSDPRIVTGGLTSWAKPGASGLLPIDSPTDVVGVTPDGIPLYLDASTATVKTSTISGQRVLVAVLDSLPVVQSACAIDARTIAFVEARHPDTVFVRRISASSPRAVPLVAAPRDSLPPVWTVTRFGGAMGSGCVLWAPNWRSVATLVDATIHSEWPLHWASATPSWPRRLLAWLTHRTVRPVFAEDVTMFPGGVAVLSDAGTVIDLYGMDAGQYLRSLSLPRPVLRIGGDEARIFTLRQASDSILFASFILPETARALANKVGRGLAETDSTPQWLRLLRQTLR